MENTDRSEDMTEGGNRRQAYSSRWNRGLPSHGKADKSYLAGLADKIKSGISVSGYHRKCRRQIDTYLYSLKIIWTIKDLKETYFRCETEYIISGDPDEAKPEKNTAVKIKTLRNMLNLYYLYTCSESAKLPWPQLRL